MSWINFFVFLLSAQIGQVTNSLPSLNYWGLSSKLASDASMQKRLGVSGDQIVAILEMRKLSRIEDLLEEEEEKQRLDPVVRKDSISHDQLLSNLDNIIIGKLRLIINDFQIDQLRRVELQRRYLKSYQIFQDPEVIRFLGLSGDNMQRLSISRKAAKSKFDAERSSLHEEAALAIVRVLPSESKELFSQYAGNSYSPEVEVRNDIELSSIPYPWEFNSIMSMRSLLKKSDLQTRHSITQGQVEQLIEVSKKFEDKAFRPNKSLGNSFEEFLKESRTEVWRILNNSQLLSISRWRAIDEFNNDFCSPFERDEFLVYLKIVIPTDIQAIREIVTAERNEFQAKEKKLNERTFGEICSSLPEDAQQRLRLVFDGVWK